MTELIDYDKVAAQYDARYQRNDYSGVAHALAAFVENARRASSWNVLEVGCGTGHWIRFFRDSATHIVGLDPSRGMLEIARTRLPDGRLIRAAAEALPCRTASFDRIFCVNALHHVTDPAAFFREARRALTDGGRVLTIGLDPHAGRDRWWVYDYFPTALIEDRRRYLSAARIRELMEAAGFTCCDTCEVQHIPARMTVGEAARRGFLDRASTSQLMVISQAEYDAGLKQIHRSADDGGPILRADLRLYGTSGWAV